MTYNRIYTYIHAVKSDCLSIHQQQAALTTFCKVNEYENVTEIVDTDSSKLEARLEAQLLLRMVGKGDLVVLVDIDRASKRVGEATTFFDRLLASGADVVVVNRPAIDTRGVSEELRPKLVAVILDLLRYLDDRQRAYKNQRQQAGREAMYFDEEIGKHVSIHTGGAVGRPPHDFPERWPELFTQWRNREITSTYFMQETGVPKTSFYRLVKRWDTIQAKDAK